MHGIHDDADGAPVSQVDQDDLAAFAVDDLPSSSYGELMDTSTYIEGP
jgi:hypothetical protein